MTVDEERPIVQRTLLFGIASIVIGVILPILAIEVSFRPDGEQLNTWFQRSGSIMVIVAVWAEVKLSSIHHMLNPTGLITEECDTLSKEYGAHYTTIVWLVALVAAAGTLIWGYGDLLI